MTQDFTSPNYPNLPINIRIGTSPIHPDFEYDIEAAVDTGFDGGLAIPASDIPNHAIPVMQSPWEIADGSVIFINSYYGYIKIGTLPLIPTTIIGLPSSNRLLGRQVIDNYRFILNHGLSITVEI